MNKFLVIGALFSNVVFAGGWVSGWTTYGDDTGTVDFVEIVRAQGFLIKGKFGNPADCSQADYIWIAIEHPQYDQLYSTALAAFMSNKKVQAYAHSCTEIGWHGGYYNTLSSAGSLYLKN